MKTSTQDGRRPIHPLCPTQNKNWKMCSMPPTLPPLQENIMESV